MGIFSAKSICNVQKPLNSGSGSRKETWLAHPWPPPWPSEAPPHTLAVRVSCYQELSSTHISEHPSSTRPPKRSLLFPQQPTRGPFWHEQKRGNLLGAPHFDLIRRSKVRTFIFTPNSDSENQRSPWGRGTNLQYSFLFSQPAPFKGTNDSNKFLAGMNSHPPSAVYCLQDGLSLLHEWANHTDAVLKQGQETQRGRAQAMSNSGGFQGGPPTACG